MGEPRSRSYDTDPWSPHSCPDADKLAAVRAALPATSAGIYLNAGSVGPMPAETAAAMAEPGGLRPRDRPGRARRFCRARSSGWTRPGPPSPRCSAATRDEVALTHCDDRRHEHRQLGARLAARGPGRDDEARACRRPRPAVRAPRPARGRARHGRPRGDDADDDEILATLDAAISPGTQAGLDLATWPVDDGLLVCRSPGSPSSPTSAAPSSLVDGAQAARRDPGQRRDARRRLLRDPRPEVAARARKGSARPAVAARTSSSGVRQTFAGISRTRRTISTGAAEPCIPMRAGSRRRASIGRRSSGMARSLRLAVDVRRARLGLRARRRDWPGRRPTRLAAIPGVTLLTPRDRMADARHVPDRRLAAAGRARGARGAHRSRSSGRCRPSTRCGSASASATAEEELDRFATAVEPARGAHARDASRRGRPLTILGQDG